MLSLHTLRNWWRAKLRPFWSKYQWLVVWLMAFVAIVCGYFGFRAHAASARESVAFGSLLYRTLQLFQFGIGCNRRPYYFGIKSFYSPCKVSLTNRLFELRVKLYRLRLVSTTN